MAQPLTPAPMPSRPPLSSRPRQRGAALLLAMMIVALITTMAAAMVWQQWRAVQVEAAERARTQSDWILLGALDWARLILREDGRPNTGSPIDHLGEPWAVPLAEARLSTFLAADKNNNTDDGPDAFLSGSITDAQARYNLRNLVGPDGKLDKNELAVLQRLLDSVGVSQELATVIAKGMVNSTRVTPTVQPSQLPGSAPTPTAPPAPPEALPPITTSQIAWLGLDPETVKRLEPYLVVLPKHTPINANTAGREVLAAVLNVDMGTAERLTQSRQRTPFKSTEDVKKQLPPNQAELKPGRMDIFTEYFEIRGRLRLEDKVLEERTLVERLKDSSIQVRALLRERINSSSAAP